MTFTEIVAEVAARLNLTSTEALTRIGRNVNVRYKRITSAIGLQSARRVNVQATATLGVRYLTFTGVEKLISVQDRSTGTIRTLNEVTVEEIDDQSVGDDLPSEFAVYRMNAGSVQIYLNVNPQTAFTLYAEGMDRADTLSGTDEPAFSESFHDVLVEGGIADELRKQEKLQLALEQEHVYDRRLGDLQMWIAKSAFQDIVQGKRAPRISSGAGSSGGSSAAGSGSYTQTGLVTFDRSSAAPDDAPFAVAAGANKVDNLDADKLDGLDSTAFALAVHHTQHESGGSDAIKLDDLAAPDDNTDLNASASAHGLLKKLSGTATEFLDGSGAFDTVKDSDLSTSDITTNNVSSTKHGFVPKATLDTGNVLRADAAYGVGYAQVCQGRLTLTTGVPVTTADVTGATTMRFAPYGGNRLALFDGTYWKLFAFPELSLALGTLTNDLPYDVFVYDNAGTPTLEFTAWSTKTARATALTTQDGVLSKTGALTRRYLGTFHTTATTTTEDSRAKRLLWNYYNRASAEVLRKEATASWAYTTATIRQANASTANQIAIVVGVAEDNIHLAHTSVFSNTSAAFAQIGIGEDSTTTLHADYTGGVNNVAAGANVLVTGNLVVYPPIGYHFYAMLEGSQATGTTTWFGTPTFVAAVAATGLSGTWKR